MPDNREITFASSICEGLSEAMSADDNVVCFGLGATDPKSVFGTMGGLEKSFGSKRVFDMPTSENAMTGVAIGAAIDGLKVVMCHQRFDFFLLAIDQLVNNAAKWHFMFGGQRGVNITIRLIIGRGWGQGPTHSQSLHSWFAHVPGIKIVCPSSAYDAKGLLIASINDPNPVIFIEHRWLHNSFGHVPSGSYMVPIGKSKLVMTGSDITLVGISHMTLEGMRAAQFLLEKGISVDLIDLRSVSPIDWNVLFESVNKTGRILIADIAHTSFSIGSEIVTRIVNNCWSALKCAPQVIGCPDIPTPTAYSLTKDFYPTAQTLAGKIIEMVNSGPVEGGINTEFLQEKANHDVPGVWFRGPF